MKNSHILQRHPIAVMNVDRNRAISIARDNLSLFPVYLDTETTGLDRNAEIVEICVVNHDDQVLYQSLVKPTSSIPSDVTRIHGITDAMVKDAPNWLRVWLEVQDFLLGKHVGVYNAEFDIRMIQQTNARYGLATGISAFSNYFCIMKLFAQYYGDWDRSRAHIAGNLSILPASTAEYRSLIPIAPSMTLVWRALCYTSSQAIDQHEWLI